MMAPIVPQPRTWIMKPCFVCVCVCERGGESVKTKRLRVRMRAPFVRDEDALKTHTPSYNPQTHPSHTLPTFFHIFR